MSAMELLDFSCIRAIFKLSLNTKLKYYIQSAFMRFVYRYQDVPSLKGD